MPLAQDPYEPKAGDCILFSTADWDTPYWTNKQHTADHLVKAGWRVLYIESIGLRAPKMGSGTDWGRIAKRLWRGLQGPRQMQDGLWVLSPLVVPFKHNHPWVRALNQGLLSWTISRFSKKTAFNNPIVWTYHPYMLEVLENLEQRKQSFRSLIYHCVDDLSAMPGINADAFNAEERRLLLQADATFTTSKSLYEKCSGIGKNVHDLPNVVDVQHFGKAFDAHPLPTDMSKIPMPRLGYVGALSDFKIDFPLLKEVAEKNPQWSFVVIGEEREGQHDPTLAAMARLQNVFLLGRKQYADLPNYLRGMQVGLLPTLINDYTRSMFPMKFYEYIAAGLPVVSTPLDFLQGKTSPTLAVASHPEEYASAIANMLATQRMSREVSLLLVSQNTWSERLKKMLRLALPQTIPPNPR
jgi:glycosyltransferase involved in cell wall biosynthesis